MVEVRVSTDGPVAGRYRLLGILHEEEGRIHWLGQDVVTARPVGLARTRLPAHLCGETAGDVAARMLRETEAVEAACPGRVPALVDVVTVAAGDVRDGGGEGGGSVWTVTEGTAGPPGGVCVGRGPVDPVRAARTGLAVLDVLAAAHGAGIVHGDLSPGQVLVGERGEAMVTGFGLMGAAVSPRVTAPSYASPEQARGEGAGPASDLWALGAILYTMVEGRPPFRDRGPVEATLRAVGRLPLRSPLNAGPLGPAIQGLLRRDPSERLPEPVVRKALTRIVRTEAAEAARADSARLRGPCAAARHRARTWGGRRPGRTAPLWPAVAVAAVAAAIAVAAAVLPGGGSPAAAPAPSRAASGGPSATATGRQAPSAPATAPAPPPAGGDPPAGYVRYEAPEGFAIDLPRGFERRTADGFPGLSYRVTFRADGDPRTLAVTYSERLGADPVAVWSALEPALRRRFTGYERVGGIRAVTYRGREGADIQWLSGTGSDRERTFGRGFLLGAHRGYSLRWTTPAGDWDTAANRQALAVFLRSFRDTSG
ncbi:serine/threonine protein kinase [Streptomyces sp. NPDC008313]|uniref:protein kinase domain-containing protein n=1 Tax=Streptomyces sp. NPDC008313 TaxID=3364826 RepID=UPI0036E88EFB